MKTKQVSKILAIALSTAALAIYGCGRDGGSTAAPATTTTGTTTTTTVSTSTQAQSAGAAATSSTSLSAGLGNTLSNIAAPLGNAGVHVPRYKSSLADKDPAVKVINEALEKAVANNAPLMRATTSLRSAALSTGNRATPILSTTSNCANGGTVTFNGNYDATVTPATLSLAATFLDCKEDNQRNNGYMAMTGTFSTSGTTVTETFTMALRDTASGTGKFTSDFFANNYTVLTGKLAENMSISGTSTVAATTTTTFTGTGTMNYTDFLNAGQTYTITLTNLKETMSSSTVSAVTTTTSTVNGTVKEEWTASGTANSVTIVFGTTTADFALTIVSASTYEDTTASGTIAITTTPTTLCSGGGTFTIATTTAIRYDKSLNRTTAGRATINTDQVVMVWNANGSIDVSLSGGTATNYANENAFQSACSFADLPTNTGTTTTSVTTGTTDTTGSTLTATLTWQDSASATAATNSDMDLHLKYYNTTTTPSTNATPTWNIDFVTKSVNIDSTHTGVLDYDMCVGSCPTGTVTAGPEHITLQALPQGYYVLSVNSYALQGDLGAVLTVTLQIGSNTFSFPAKTLTVADVDGTDYTNSWYRVTDILVDSTGVHLKPAVTTVTPAPPFASRAPKVGL